MVYTKHIQSLLQTILIRVIKSIFEHYTSSWLSGLSGLRDGLYNKRHARNIIEEDKLLWEPIYWKGYFTHALIILSTEKTRLQKSHRPPHSTKK